MISFFNRTTSTSPSGDLNGAHATTPAFFLLFLAMAVLLPATGPLHARTLTLETTSNGATAQTAFYKGENLYLNILVDDAAGIAGCAFALTYPAGALTAPQITSEGLPLNANDITSSFGFTFLKDGTRSQTHRENLTVLGDTGKIYFSGAAINQTTGGAKSLGGPIVLFTVKFTVKSDATVRGYHFSLSPTTLNNTLAGYSAGGEAIPLLVGALDKNHAGWNTLSAAYPVLLQTMAAVSAPVVVSFVVPASYEETVQKIFIGYYRRPADPAGLLYWADRLSRSNGSLAEIIEAFANSDESRALYGTIDSSSISTVVNNIYRALFNRDADPDGLAYYVAGFNEGRFTAATIMLNILYGATGGADLDSINNKVAAAKLFTRTIDPDLNGADFQVTYAGDNDVIEGRIFLSTLAGPTTIPNQGQITAFIRANIADPADPIHNTLYAALLRGSGTSTAVPAAPAPSGLNRSAPFPRSRVVSAPNWEVSVLDTLRGGAAWRALRAADPLADPAPAGMEYLLVKLRAKSSYADSAGHPIGRGDFRVTGDRLIDYPHASLIPPWPALGATLPAGGETEGWVPYRIGTGEGNLILIFDELSNTNEQDLRFIALDDNASIGVDPALAAIPPTDIGSERVRPAPFQQRMVHQDWEISVLEAVRGDAATRMVHDANRVDTPPPEGLEYVAARIHLKYIGTEERSVSTRHLLFRTTGSRNLLYDPPAAASPPPALDAALFPGGETEGWVVAQVANGETGVVLVIDVLDDFSGTGKRFASLEP